MRLCIVKVIVYEREKCIKLAEILNEKLVKKTILPKFVKHGYLFLVPGLNKDKTRNKSHKLKQTHKLARFILSRS